MLGFINHSLFLHPTMLKPEQIGEIRKHLEEALNPLFFFDDDQDGIASFLLLKRKYQKGRGIPAKTRTGDNGFYIRKLKEISPDLVVFLDRPVVAQEVIDAANCPVLWIDHHQPLKRDGVKYYNPMVLTPGDNRPTSYWAYQIAQQDLWIALVGIIGDWFMMPELNEKFEYKELLGNATTPPEALFDQEFGKLVKIFNFITKGTSTEARKNLAVLEKINSPYELLKQESAKGKFLWKKYEKINKEYEVLLEKALKEVTEDNMYVFRYPTTKYSFTGGLANELIHKLDKDVFIIARENTEGDIMLSIRGKTVDVLPMLNNVLKTIHGYGGGHARACGAGMKAEDFPKFIEGMKKELAKVKSK